MQFETLTEVSRKHWDQLVERQNGGVFSHSAYLDATADHWEILWNEGKTGGMACAFTLKLGVKTLYAPFFHRYTQWIGEGEPKQKDLIALLKERYRVAAAHYCSDKHFLFKKRMFQELRKADYKQNQQAKRMLKKAAVFEVVEKFEPERLLKLIDTELTDRVAEIDGNSMAKLQNLVDQHQKLNILQFNLLCEGEWHGGIWIVPFGERMLYLKGTTTSEAKELGGMYKLMHHAISFCFEHDGIFDFGGSNVTGVKRFNHNWGATDKHYYYFRWNNAPFWWNALRKGRQLWKK